MLVSSMKHRHWYRDPARDLTAACGTSGLGGVEEDMNCWEWYRLDLRSDLSEQGVEHSGV